MLPLLKCTYTESWIATCFSFKAYFKNFAESWKIFSSKLINHQLRILSMFNNKFISEPRFTQDLKQQGILIKIIFNGSLTRDCSWSPLKIQNLTVFFRTRGSSF